MSLELDEKGVAGKSPVLDISLLILVVVGDNSGVIRIPRGSGTKEEDDGTEFGVVGVVL